MTTSNRQYLRIADHTTEVISFASAACGRSPDVRILLWPGNPGNAAYYVPFMEALMDATGGRASVETISNLGQCNDGIAEQTFSLEQQTAHKLIYLQQEALGPGRPPVCLIGHSIGAHIALANVRALQEAGQCHQLQQVVALFPFLSFDESSWRQAALERLVAWPRVVGVCGAALGCLPLALSGAILRSFAADLDDHAVSTTLTQLSYRHATNAMVLAGHEFRDLRAALDWKWLQSLGSRLAIIYALNDKWFPEVQCLELQRQLPTLQVQLDKAMSHGFCASAAMSKALAPAVAALCGFAKVVPESQPSSAACATSDLAAEKVSIADQAR